MKTCPVCNSTSVFSSETSVGTSSRFGEPVTYIKSIDQCKSCGFASDFDDATGARFRQARLQSAKASVAGMLEHLTLNNISHARLERAFELPPRTSNRWKNGDISAAAIALLQCVRAHPHLVAEAENAFSASGEWKTADIIQVEVENSDRPNVSYSGSNDSMVTFEATAEPRSA